MLIFVFVVIPLFFISLVGFYFFYRLGYRNGGMEVLHEWKEFNIKMFGEEDPE